MISRPSERHTATTLRGAQIGAMMRKSSGRPQVPELKLARSRSAPFQIGAIAQARQTLIRPDLTSGEVERSVSVTNERCVYTFPACAPGCVRCTLYSAHVHLYRCTCAVQAHACIMRKKCCARLSCTCTAVSIERPALWDLRVVIGSSLDGAFKTKLRAATHCAHQFARDRGYFNLAPRR